MSNFAIGALLGLLAALAWLATGRLQPDDRGFSPPPADPGLDIPLWIVLLLFAGMGVLGPLFILLAR